METVRITNLFLQGSEPLLHGLILVLILITLLSNVFQLRLDFRESVFHDIELMFKRLCFLQTSVKVISAMEKESENMKSFYGAPKKTIFLKIGLGEKLFKLCMFFKQFKIVLHCVISCKYFCLICLFSLLDLIHLSRQTAPKTT